MLARSTGSFRRSLPPVAGKREDARISLGHLTEEHFFVVRQSAELVGIRKFGIMLVGSSSFETRAGRAPHDEASASRGSRPHGEEVRSTVSNHDAATISVVAPKTRIRKVFQADLGRPVLFAKIIRFANG